MTATAQNDREMKRDPNFILRSDTISVALTVLALVATVVAIYFFFPRRDNELLTEAAVEHRRGGPYDVEEPSERELRAWSTGLFGARYRIAWPAPEPGRQVVGARRVDIQKRRTALVRYRVGDEEVSLVVQRGHDVPPRSYRRQDGDEWVQSWRDGKWTFVLVGAASTKERWLAPMGAR